MVEPLPLVDVPDVSSAEEVALVDDEVDDLLLLVGPELVLPLGLVEVLPPGLVVLLRLGLVEVPPPGLVVVPPPGVVVPVVVLVGSSRGVVVVVVPGGSCVPGGTKTSLGIGVPGGSTYGASGEPAAGTIVTTGCPFAPTETTTVGWVERGNATPLTVMVPSPGTGLPVMTCGPDAVLVLPARRSEVPVDAGDTSSASPPNAVASTTPLTASITYPLRFARDEGSRGGATSVR